ncbi:MAG: hypothetical protein N2257_02900 [Thermodesulfovibrionales bacterium]|nr:hypothetical protein [Thermodesulfovibrionales bacterium]
MRYYSSIEDLRKDFNDIIIPTYIPEFLAWPPSKIIGQKKPYRAVALELMDKKNNVALILVESERKEFRMKGLSPVEVKEVIRHVINGREAILRVGKCRQDFLISEEHTCSELTWREGRYFINLTLKSGPFELLKIAESMIH